MTIVPDNAFRISCTQVGPDGRFTQFHSTEITPAIYEKEIAPARTFVFYEDVKPLMDKGLIKGGSLENAVVVRGRDGAQQGAAALHGRVRAAQDSRYRRRPRALRPRRSRGTSSRSSRATVRTRICARAIAKQHAQAMALVPPSVTPKGGDVLDVNDVMKLLPHRFPFLMVDRIVSIEGETKCTGVKSVTMNEYFFQGHFPGHPVMPGVLQLEAMAQVGSILILRKPGYAGKIGYFMSADDVKFRKPVVPGDTLFIEVEMTQHKKDDRQARKDAASSTARWCPRRRCSSASSIL